MKALPEAKPPISYSCDLLSLDNELRSPKLTALIEQGYKIKAVVPVEDQGKPVAILILQHEEANKANTIHYIMTMLLGAILAVVLGAFLHSFTL